MKPKASFILLLGGHDLEMDELCKFHNQRRDDEIILSLKCYNLKLIK
jgi:hypothetical protein